MSHFLIHSRPKVIAPVGQHGATAPREVGSSGDILRAFSASIIKGLTRPNGIGRAREALRNVTLSDRSVDMSRGNLARAYEEIFGYLSSFPRGEYFYKSALIHHCLYGRHGSSASRMLFELRAGRSKLDVLVAKRGRLVAYEIKTELDHFRRLPSQLADYAKRFPEIWVLTAERSATRLSSTVDQSVGIAFLTRHGRIRVEREASVSMGSLDSVRILECLRRDEYLSVVSGFGFDGKDIPNTRIFSEAMSFAKSLDPSNVHRATLAVIRSRPEMLSSTALATIPPSLRAACVAAQCTATELSRIERIIHQ